MAAGIEKGFVLMTPEGQYIHVTECSSFGTQPRFVYHALPDLQDATFWNDEGIRAVNNALRWVHTHVPGAIKVPAVRYTKVSLGDLLPQKEDKNAAHQQDGH